MSKTTDNLKAAFAGESQANRKYLAFAEIADKEGFPQVAKLFRAAAAAETVHAHSQLRALGGILSTAENLKEAAGGEHYEWVDMYPAFIEDAKAENETRAQKIFENAMAVEKEHEELYAQAFNGLGQDSEELYDYYICPVCGHTHPRSAPEKCPICGAPGSRFFKVE